MSRSDKKKILVVDDHPIVRRGFAMLINQEPDLTVCGEAENAAHALELAQLIQPDLMIVDLFLKSSSGIDLIKDMKAQHPQLPVLVVSMHDESLYAERVIRAGARGYIMKQEADEIVVSAIRKVLKGGIFLSDRMQEKIITSAVQTGGKTLEPVELLSDRELEIFQMIGQGKTTRQIADEFHISVKTVESYRARIKEKLNVHTSTELAQKAFQWIQEKA